MLAGAKTPSGEAGLPEKKQGIDTGAAEAYETHLVSKVFGPWARRALEIAAPGPGEAVLDVACGTGIGARLAAPKVRPGGRVVGIDSDPGMIAVAQRLAVALKPAIEWHCRSALEMPFAAGEFDMCLCLQGPQFFPDPAQGLGEIRRVLKPAGRLVATLWCAIEHNKGHYAIAQALERQGVAPALKPFSLGEAEAVRVLFSKCGFQITDLRREDMFAKFPSAAAFIQGVAAGAPATRHAIAKLAAHHRQAFVEDVRRILEPYHGGGGLRLPTSAHIVVARP